MRGHQLKATGYAFAFLCMAAGGANAGGLERGGYNIDLLFDPGAFVMGSTATYVSPQRKLEHTTGGFGGSTSARESADYLVFSSGIKINVVPAVDCLFQYSQPWGAHSDPGAGWTGARSNIETKIDSDNLGATCSYKFNVGPGDLRLIGGGFWQKDYGFKDRQVAPSALAVGTGVGHLELSGEGYGWRAGIAYEIPEIAFRTSLVYNSEVKLNDITGILDLTQVSPAYPAPFPVEGAATMPQTVELKAQSGIAPGWLAFGSVKWVDWSVLQTVPFYVAGNPVPVTSLQLLYRDGWTASAGIGHKFNDQLSGAVGLTWDRGVSQDYGSQTDTWTINAGLIFTPTKMMEFRVGGAAGILTAGSSSATIDPYGVGYSFGNDFVGALSVSARVKF